MMEILQKVPKAFFELYRLKVKVRGRITRSNQKKTSLSGWIAEIMSLLFKRHRAAQGAESLKS